MASKPQAGDCASTALCASGWSARLGGNSNRIKKSRTLYSVRLFWCYGSGLARQGRVIPFTSPPTSFRLSYRNWITYLPLWANAPGSFWLYW
ncbi:MAG: hypothetical protein HW404_256 [Anaerolineales bacterium]|nr:hypothetical protein [Anaerolineales bacterium]